MTDKRTLTTGEVANFCNVNVRTVIRWVDQGQLKGYELPGRGDKRIEMHDLLAFLRKHKMPIPAEIAPYLKRILIVDDVPFTATSIQRLLHRAGYETAIATDGFQAGTMIPTFSPAVMTLDLNMPNINGYQVLQKIRSDERLSYLKVLIISAAEPEDFKRALDLGADDFLEKPISNKALIEKIALLTESETAYKR